MYYCSFIYKCNKLTNVIYSFTNAMNTFINVCIHTFTNVMNIFIITISKFDNGFSTFTYVNKTFIDGNLKIGNIVIAICTTTNIIDSFVMYLALPFSTVVNNSYTNILIKKFTTVINMSPSNVIETFSLNVHQPTRTVVIHLLS